MAKAITLQLKRSQNPKRTMVQKFLISAIFMFQLVWLLDGQNEP